MRSSKQVLCMFAIALVVALITWVLTSFPWLLLLPVAILVIGYPVYLIRRTFALRWKGYFVAHSRQHRIIYEERRDDLVAYIPIHTAMVDHGCHEVIVPTREEWLRTAPDWAKDRRDEIFKRIIKAQPKGWAALPDDWPA
jgi:hypothetical protein